MKEDDEPIEVGGTDTTPSSPPETSNTFAMLPVLTQRPTATCVTANRIYSFVVKRVYAEVGACVEGLSNAGNCKGKKLHWLVEGVSDRLNKLNVLVKNVGDALASISVVRTSDATDSETDKLVLHICKLTSQLNALKSKTIEQVLVEHFKCRVSARDIKTFLKCMEVLSHDPTLMNE